MITAFSPAGMLVKPGVSQRYLPDCGRAVWRQVCLLVLSKGHVKLPRESAVQEQGRSES